MEYFRSLGKALQVWCFIHEVITKHNWTYRPTSYLVKTPYMYPISPKKTPDIIAMSKTDMPPLSEVLNPNNEIRFSTLFDRLELEHGLTKADMEKASREMVRPPRCIGQVFYYGIEDKKFIFVPFDFY